MHNKIMKWDLRKKCTFATLFRRRKLGLVNFHKDFWDCYEGQGKFGPIARASERSQRKSQISQDFPTQIRGKANGFRFQEIFGANFTKKQLITNG